MARRRADQLLFEQGLLPTAWTKAQRFDPRRACSARRRGVSTSPRAARIHNAFSFSVLKGRGIIWVSRGGVKLATRSTTSVSCRGKWVDVQSISDARPDALQTLLLDRGIRRVYHADRVTRSQGQSCAGHLRHDPPARRLRGAGERPSSDPWRQSLGSRSIIITCECELHRPEPRVAGAAGTQPPRAPSWCASSAAIRSPGARQSAMAWVFVREPQIIAKSAAAPRLGRKS